MDPVIARKNWRTLEPLHGFIYFAPEAVEAYAALGVTGRSGYFASRSAPMGAVPAEVVIATFFNFYPPLVRDAMEGVWDRTTPAAMVEARLSAVDAVLRRVFGDDIESPEVVEAAGLLRTAAEACELAGRPLAAGHASLERPSEPHLALWHDLAIVREFRGDGHIASLVHHGIGPCEALVLHGGTGMIPEAGLRDTRAWPHDAWEATMKTCQERGWIGDDRLLTAEGSALRESIDEQTDRNALMAWEAIGEDASDRLRTLARPWSKAVFAGMTISVPGAE